MVDKSDLERVNRLFEEWRIMQAAIENFDAGGVIISMTVSGQPLEDMFQPMPPPTSTYAPPRMAISVPTVSIQYPPQMVEGIKSQFRARQAEISQELADFGVTGTEAPATPTTPAAVAATAPPRPSAPTPPSRR